MEETMTLHDIRREFGVVFGGGGQRISQFGGLETVIQFLKRGRFRERLASVFGQYKARSMLQIMLGVIAGADDMEAVARVAQDPVVRRALGNPVGAIQLARDLKSFTKAEVERLHEFNVRLSLYSIMDQLPFGSTITFDIDATAVQKYGVQQGVERGYVDRDKIEPCYQYLLFRLHELESIFYGTIREGSTHCQNGIGQYFKRFLPHFKDRWELVCRLDAGFFNEQSFDILSANEVTYFIKAPISETRSEFAFHSRELVWGKNEADLTDKAEYASILTKTKAGSTWREVFKRTQVVITDSRELRLKGVIGYSFECIATNDFTKPEWSCYEFYNKRANVENTIKQSKYDYRLGQIVTDSFDANDVITQLTILAYNLMSHFKRKALPEPMQPLWLSTLRWKLLNVPARLVSHAKERLVRIFNVFVSNETYGAIFSKIKNMKSWVLNPPNPDALNLPDQ